MIIDNISLPTPPTAYVFGGAISILCGQRRCLGQHPPFIRWQVVRVLRRRENTALTIFCSIFIRKIFFSCDYFTDSFKAHIRCYVHETAYRGFQNNIHNFGKFPGVKAPKKLSNEAKLKNKSYFRFLNQGDTYDIDHRQNKVGSL